MYEKIFSLKIIRIFLKVRKSNDSLCIDLMETILLEFYI